MLRRRPEIDLVRVQDVGLSETDDRVILEWAAQQGRVLLNHDVATMTRYAYKRVQAGLEMPGVFEISRSVPVGLAIEYCFRYFILHNAFLHGEYRSIFVHHQLCKQCDLYKINE
jgi:formate dehydrogenase assembly factor FdhD